MADVVLNPFVGNNDTCLDRGREHHAFESLATAQGYIHLSWCKREIGIDNSTLEGQALTLMDGDGPSQT